MAASQKKAKHDIQLPLKVSSKKLKEILPDNLQSVCRGFLEDLPLLNSRFQKEKLPFINVKNVNYITGCDITFTFEVETENDLKNFYKASKANILSAVLTDYAVSCGLSMKANLAVDDSLDLSMVMGKTDYHKHMLALCEDENSKNDPVNTSKDIRESVVASAAVESKLENQERQVSKTSEVRMCICNFYVYLPFKTSHIARVTIDSECKELNHLILKTVPGMSNIWEVHVKVPVNMIKCTKYCYKVNVEEYQFKVYKTTNCYKSVSKLLSSDVIRDEFENSTKEGFTAHCLHILSVCNQSTLCDCIHQVEWISSSLKISLIEVTEIVSILQSTISETNSKALILLAVILISVVKNVWKLLETNCISKELAWAMLDSFKTVNAAEFSDSCRMLLPHFLETICIFCFGKDHGLLGFLHATYPFLDDRFFNDKIANSKEQLCLTDVNISVLSETVFNIGSRLEKGSEVLELLKRLLLNLPPTLSIKGFKYYCTIFLSPGDDIHHHVKAQLLPTVITAVVADISRNMNSGKVTSLCNLWEVARDEEELVLIIIDQFQQSLISVVQKRTDKLTSTEIQCLQKTLQDTKLFYAKEAKMLLLQTLGQSKVTDLHGLFLILLWNSKFSECLLCCPGLLNTWLETAIKYHIKTECSSGREDELCSCYAYLHDALSLPNFPKDGCLQEKLKEYVFKWLTKQDVKNVLRKSEAIEKLNKEKCTVLDLYHKHVQQLLTNKCDSTKPHEVCLAVCTSEGQLRINSSHTSRIVQTVMELYCNPFGDDQYENFINMVKISQFWMLLLTMEGSQTESTKSHKIFKEGIKCIEFILESFQSKKITCSYLEKISKVQDAKQLLVAIGQKSKTDIEKLWKTTVSVVQREKEKVSCVMNILSKVRKFIPDKSLPDEWNEFERHFNDVDKKLKGGKLSTSYVLDGSQVWFNYSRLPSLCEKLICYIDSQVFWNACLHILTNQPELVTEWEQFFEEEEVSNLKELEKDFHDEELITLTSLKYLFKQGDHESGSFESCVHFLEVLEHRGGMKYREDWMLLCKDEEVPMTHVVNMFKNADIAAEMSLTEKSLKLTIENRRQLALQRYNNFDDYYQQVQAMEKTLNALGIRSYSDTKFFEVVESFDKLMAMSVGEISLEQVSEAIKTVHNMTQGLNKDGIQVLSVLGESTSLIQFLKDVADVDLRNLIDAVEEVSEHSVNETTVLGLIDVKSFLQPVLKKSTESDVKNLFQTILKQMKKIKPKELVGKISDCRDNLHNLKSLYSNVANIGLKTREIIDNVIKMGIFCLKIDTTDVCVLSIEYMQNKKPTVHGQDLLIDLRSRALLLMNTESKSQMFETPKKKENLEKFVTHVETALQVGQLLTNLHMSGHFQYKLYEMKMKANGLESFKDKLNTEYRNWCSELEKCRDKYYWMNFILGSQLHILHDFLEIGNDKQRIHSMLQFIHPEIKIVGMKEYYSKLSSDGSESSLIENIALTLEDAMKDLKPVCRLMDASFIVFPRITDLVRPGKLHLVALEENSKLVMKTVLALYYNTVRKLPEPHQILFCSEDTSWVEVQLLIHRSVRSKEENLFCIANVEMLSNEIQFKLVEALHHLSICQTFLLSIICCGTENHPIFHEFSDCIMPVHPISDNVFTNILQKFWPDVLSITSDVPGLGKTETIRQKSQRQNRGVATFHISGPLNRARLVHRLADMRVRQNDALHIDIGNIDNPFELDAFLFEIIVLGFASTGRACVCLPTKYIFIEIANTINHQLKDALKTAMSFKRKNLSWQFYSNFIVSNNINSPVQVVCQYLNALDDGTIDSKDIYFTGKKAVCPLPRQKCQQLLRKYFRGPEDMSFSIARIFINVLADQLKKMSCSTFFRTQHLQTALRKRQGIAVRSNLLHALLNTCSEFASRSVNNCRMLQASAVKLDSGAESKAGEMSIGGTENLLLKRVEGMVRWEDTNHLIFVFHNQDIQTLSAMYRKKSEVPNHIKTLFESQIKEALPDFNTKTASELQDILQRVARTHPIPLSKEKLEDMATEYALTPDNLLKMVLIMLRIKANIPVLIMGETGCGKTSLIRYLSQICEVYFEVVQIHAGVEEEFILASIEQIRREAENNFKKPVWLFLDEINTCNHLGLISDVLCHHKCLGKTLPPNVVVMAACNPYKQRPEKKVSTAGLPGKIQFDEMSRLVYRVFPMPETMVDYVWDFGTISEKDEEAYVHRMIQNVFKDSPQMDQLLADLAIMSQRVVRNIEDSESAVSLRDVNRCKLLAKWFQNFMKKKKMHGSSQSKDFLIRCMILALAHCYHCRFENALDRKRYRNGMADVFHCHEIEEYDENKIQDIITEEQIDILNRMELQTGTAQNTALQENVFVILVCILNKIPIFVVGKPGCSKSLSIQVIRSNLRGRDSKDPLFKSLPQLNCVSFQGSESSTSDGIKKVFEKAQRYQENNNPKEVLSVVILDEIGLAEISRFNPLKVLHSLLEPEGKQFPDVAVVGISNWALDAAKMNRAIHLSRPEMDVDELFLTGKSISKSLEKNPADSSHELLRTRPRDLKRVEIDKELKSLADSYMKYIEKQTFANFHGLRDYYSLVKYIAKTLSELDTQDSTDAIKMKVINRGLQRNFGGMPSESSTLQELFKANLQSLEDFKVPVIDLIVENIQDKMARHLMLITSGDAAFDILEQQLGKLEREAIPVYGSRFEEDLTDDYNYRILNKIILCMEQGLVLILKDLDSIYGSLYDMLNQNYTVVGEKKYCRVALGPYSNPMCQVHDDFRCIVLVDESKMNLADPPFLNRFEKQNLKFADILSQNEHVVIKDLEHWVQKLTNIPSKHFKVIDVIPVYGVDMIPSLVHKYFLKMKENSTHTLDNEVVDELTSACKQRLLWVMKPESVIRIGLSEFGRNPKTSKEAHHIIDEYIHLPIHEGLQKYLQSKIDWTYQGSEHSKMFMIFTNSNIHTNIQAILPSITCQVDKLGAFKSEKQLTQRIQFFWSEADQKCLILQCRSLDDELHILLARNIMERTRKENLNKPHASTKHVCMIIHLDRMKNGSKAVPQINFLTEWKLVMLDSLEEPKLPLLEVVNKSMIETIEQRRPLSAYIQEQLFWAFTRIQYASGGRSVESIQSVIEQIRSSEEFLTILDEAIFKWIKEQQENVDVKNWWIEVSCDTHALYSSSTFSDALENYIAQVINDPLARILFELEKVCALSTFFHEDASADVQLMWRKLFNEPEIFSIQNTPKPTEAECYACSSPVLHFRVPFFKVFYEKIETTKYSFLEAVQSVKSTAEIEDIDDMPEIIWKELLLHQESLITQEVPELTKITYKNWLEDYKTDFFDVTSYQIIKGLSDQQRVQAMRWCLLGEIELHNIHPTAVISDMHAGFWVHSSLLQSELQLLDICNEILGEKSGITSLLQSISKDIEPVELFHLYVTQQEEKLKPLEDAVVSSGNATVTVDNSMQEGDQNFDNSSAIKTSGASIMHDTLGNKDDKIPFSEVAISIMPNQDKKKRCELLVEYLCKVLLPGESTLGKFSNVTVWHQRVSSVLIFANQVSMDPSVLHALRLCCDVTAQIVLTQPSEINNLKHLGLLLQNDLPLDAEEIRKLMKDMIETCKGIHSDNAQRLIAAYCSRCIGANPDTEIMIWLMDLISDGSLPDNMLTHLKPPIHHALHTELALDSNILFKLLDSDDCSLELMEESPFLMAMDTCLQKLHEDRLVDSPFPVLLIDILDQEIMRKTIAKDIAGTNATSNPQIQYFLKADSILQSGAFSLRHVTAVAYIKSFMTVLSKDLEDRDYDTSGCQVVMQMVNAVLSHNDEWIKSLQVFLLKCLGNGKWIFHLQRICKRLSDYLQFCAEDSWQKDFDLIYVEISPLSLYVSQRISSFAATFHKADDVKAIDNLVQRALSSTEDSICLYNEVMRHFYMKRLISELNDTEKTRCRLFVNCAKELKMEKHMLMVLECLSGIVDFQVDMLQLCEESPLLHGNISSFIGHLLVIMTVYGSDAGQPVSLFAKGLLDPACLSCLFLPGMPDAVEVKSSQISPAFCVSEDKNFRILRNGSSVDLHTSALHKLDMKFDCVPCRGYCLQGTSKLKETDFGSRKISRLSSIISHILLHGCFVGSVAVGFASVDDIHSLVGTEIKKEDTIFQLVQRMEMELEFLSSYLGLQQHDTVVFLHLVLYKISDLLCSDNRSMALEAERSEWEKEFSERIEMLAVDTFGRILDIRKQQNKIFGMPGEALENCVQEVDEVELENRTQRLPSLWRSTVTPSFNSLVLVLGGRKEDFQFLWLVLNNLAQIKLIKHICPILHWHLACFVTVSYNLKKKEAGDIVVSDFLCKESDDKRRKMIKEKYEQFKKSWDDIMENIEALQEFDPDFPKLEHIHGQLPLKSCLYDGPQSTIFKVLSTLVCMQNRLIDETLKIAISVKPLSLSFLRRGEEGMIPCTSLTDVTSRDIVNFEWDDSFLKYSQNDVRYGFGRQIVYDFETIEAEVASEILTNVKYLLIEDSLPSITYADELYQNSVAMIYQIQKNIKQEPLPPDLVVSIKKKKDRDPRHVSDFLTHLGMILSLLKKTSGKPDTSLVDYVDEWKNILTRPFNKILLPSPENSIRLCHLVSLHELLEELNADSIIESLDYIRVKLASHTQKKLSELLAMNPKLAELTLKAVKRFAHRCLSSEKVDISQRMINYLCDASFWPVGMMSNGVLKYGNFVQDLQGLFPEDVTVQNVYPLFQLIDSTVQEHKKKKDQQITQTKAHGTRTNRIRAAKGYRKT
ncbi:hypothetical protein CHS0354_042856 [Potamilus streckersoni]|uniref:AAA+ ATPase domain-containing protein n=1 Tax=Potamilus streckersoni TaxID=2493646 RepID=A0AAE0T610_9BIVA|nr:hypothetical protein CHS0354_042856 [Potamilus streckersoni]